MRDFDGNPRRQNGTISITKRGPIFGPLFVMLMEKECERNADNQ